MAVKKKAAGADQQAAGPKPRRKLGKATAIHFTYHPEEGIANVSVQQDVTLLGTSQRHGVDKRVEVKDLPADIQRALDTAFNGLAKEVGAAV